MAEENTSNKKPVYKKWWFWIIVVFIAICVISQNKDEGKKVSGDNSSTQATTQDAKKRVQGWRCDCF